MSFTEQRFPTTISYGSSGGFGHSTAITEVRTGQETRVARREVPRMRWNANEAVKSDDERAELITFVRAMRGSDVGFRFLDHTDYTTGANHTGAHSYDDVLIGTGDGVTKQFQLVKKYELGALSRSRPITKPIHGESVEIGEAAAQTFNVRIGVNGSEVASSGNWTVDTTTGIVTFTSAPTSGHDITAGFAFDVPSRFGIEVDDLLDIALTGFEDSEIPDVPIVEIVDEGFVDEEFYFGGAKDHGNVSANVSISLLGGRVQAFTPTTSGLKIILPDYTSIPLGGPHFYLVNQGANAMTIEDHLTNSIATLAASGSAGSTTEIHLSLNASAAKEWMAL